MRNLRNAAINNVLKKNQNLDVWWQRECASSECSSLPMKNKNVTAIWSVKNKKSWKIFLPEVADSGVILHIQTVIYVSVRLSFTFQEWRSCVSSQRTTPTLSPAWKSLVSTKVLSQWCPLVVVHEVEPIFVIIIIIIIIMKKNFDRCNSRGHHGSKRRELAQHTHPHGSYAFTQTLYINTVTTTWCEVPVQLLFFNACWVFSCFHNPPNTDMDYRIFNVRTSSFLCMRIHMRVGHINSESAQHFDSEELSPIFLVLLTGCQPQVFGSRFSMLYPLSHPVTHEYMTLWPVPVCAVCLSPVQVGGDRQQRCCYYSRSLSCFLYCYLLCARVSPSQAWTSGWRSATAACSGRRCCCPWGCPRTWPSSPGDCRWNGQSTVCARLSKRPAALPLSC